MKEVLWNRNYIAVCTANFLLFFAFYLLLPMLPLYLRDTFSADRQLIGIILSGYTITALLIRPFGGFIVDSFPRKQVLLICYFLFFAFFAIFVPLRPKKRKKRAARCRAAHFFFLITYA